MKAEKDNYKILAAASLGALGGLALGSYIWGTHNSPKSLSQHLNNLGKIVEQVEGINTVEASDLKDRIHNILNTLEASYGTTEE